MDSREVLERCRLAGIRLDERGAWEKLFGSETQVLVREVLEVSGKLDWPE